MKVLIACETTGSVIAWLIAILILITMCNCSGAFWESSKNTTSGRHTKYVKGFPSQTTCPPMNDQYIKKSNYNRYAYTKRK